MAGGAAGQLTSSNEILDLHLQRACGMPHMPTNEPPMNQRKWVKLILIVAVLALLVLIGMCFMPWGGGGADPNFVGP